MIPKCGRVNVWHWAHKDLDNGDCDDWSEPITQWHIDWQYRFPPGSHEVALGAHRADVQLPSGLIIEFQHSSLSIDEIEEREHFYGPRLIWVFDEIDAAWDERLLLRPKRGRYCTFRWKQPRRTMPGSQCADLPRRRRRSTAATEFHGGEGTLTEGGVTCALQTSLCASSRMGPSTQ